MKLVCERMEDHIIRVTIYDIDMMEMGCLYFERGKKKFVHKPVGMDSWICVDAMVGDRLYEYSGMDPKQIVERCQEEIKKMVP